MAEINFPKIWFNDAFYPLLFDESRTLALKGGGSSGKSHFCAQKFIYRALTERNLRVPLVRKTKISIRDSQYKLLQDHIKRNDLSRFFDFRDTDMRIYCPATDSEFFALGLDDKEKVKSLAQPNSMWLEEPTELTYKEWLQINIRMRGKLTEGVKYKQIVATFNPIDTDHWIHKELFPLEIDNELEKMFQWRRMLRSKNKDKWIEFKPQDVSAKMVKKVKVLDEEVELDYTLHQSNYEDNRFLDLQDKAILEDMVNKDETYYNVYCLGHWGTIGNLVFNPSWKLLNKFPDEFDEVVYGLDFGYMHASALIMVGIKDGIFYLKELLYKKKWNKPELIDYILKEGLIEYTDAEIYADSAEPDTIDLFVERGLNVSPSIKGNNSVKDSIDYLKSLTIYSHVDNTNLNREVRTYKWKEDKNGDPIEGQPVPINDDCIAAVRYAIFTHSRSSEVKAGFIRKAI